MSETPSTDGTVLPEVRRGASPRVLVIYSGGRSSEPLFGRYGRSGGRSQVGNLVTWRPVT